MKRCIVYWVFFSIIELNAQVWEAKIIDKSTLEPLPFVTIQNLTQKTAVLSDLNGFFRIHAFPNDTLKVSYLGYKTMKAPFHTFQNQKLLALEAQGIDLQGITITAKDNPAYKYIRLIQQNADRNNPLNLPSFAYTSYNKMKSFPQHLSDVPDSAYKRFFSQSDMFLWETVTERKYLRPNKSTEEVKASKMSGLPGMVIPFSPTDLQDLSFYTNWVKVLGIENLSPIASNAINHYEYELVDTTWVFPDTILTIRFYPRKNKVGFTGHLKLHTKRYNLISIIANMEVPKDFAFFKEVKIQQLYENIQDTVWFPTQLNTQILTNIQVNDNQNNSNSSFLLLTVESFIKNIRLYENFKKSDFSSVELEVSEKAHEQTDAILEQERIDTLSYKEKNTYVKIDSLAKEANLVGILNQINKIPEGFLQIRYFDLDLKRLYFYNRHEKSRLGIGLFTNEKLSKTFRFGGWVGYGFGDKTFKYGFDAILTPFNNKSWRLHLAYAYDLREMGSIIRFNIRPKQWLFQYNPYNLSVRNFYISNFEYVKHYSLNLHLPIMRRLNLQLSTLLEQTQPTSESTTYSFSEALIRIRYAPFETYNRFEHKLFIQNNPGPVFFAEIRHALPLFHNTNQYTCFSIALHQKINLHRWGKIYTALHAGYLLNQSYLSRLYVLQTMGKPAFISEPDAFNTLPFQLFLANNYLKASFQYNLNNPNFPSKKYAPDLAFSLNYFYGSNSSTDLLPNLPYQTLPKGYAEAGIALFNLAPEKLVKIIRSLQFLGLGFYYRTYGNYTFLKNYPPFAVRLQSIINL